MSGNAVGFSLPEHLFRDGNLQYHRPEVYLRAS